MANALPRNPEMMTREQIQAARPDALEAGFTPERALEKSVQRMKDGDAWRENQVLGRRYPIGCVALEITQRCNLDCSLCYLSEHSESVKDIPLEEVFRRMDLIKAHYGPGTDVQITGGDPTLREPSELLEIVRRIRSLGMRPTLMTNGIKASRALLTDLVKAGLYDVAFHVDTTQGRKPYKTEIELNKVRLQYIERARGLPIHVIFNTTVHQGNYHEVPELVAFFRKNADKVGMCSFQLQADTGRGVLRKRDDVITLDGIREKISQGAGITLTFDALQIGHRDCNYYAVTLVTNGNATDLLDHPEFAARFVRESASLELKRTDPLATAASIFKWTMKNPGILGYGVTRYLAPKLARMSKDLIASRGKTHKLSFFVHNFMDADHLDCERIESCSFKVMTDEGPISMCLHNAKRDEFILKPLKVEATDGKAGVWDPLSGQVNSEVVEARV